MIAGRNRGYVSAHGLAETYSVLTRTPFTPPLYPSEAWTILERSILPYFTVVPLDADEYQEVLREAAVRGWAGGRVYDLLHLKCAQKERCDRIYTFNVRHFREMAPASLRDKICSP
jgi:predicted nucleic acid-binding protein